MPLGRNGLIQDGPLRVVLLDEVFLKDKQLALRLTGDGHSDEDQLVLLPRIEVVNKELLAQLDPHDDAELLQVETVFQLHYLDVEQDDGGELFLE